MYCVGHNDKKNKDPNHTNHRLDYVVQVSNNVTLIPPPTPRIFPIQGWDAEPMDTEGRLYVHDSFNPLDKPVKFF